MSSEPPAPVPPVSLPGLAARRTRHQPDLANRTSIRILRAAYLVLLAGWFGSLVGVGALTAPTLFAALPDHRPLAAAAVTAVFLKLAKLQLICLFGVVCFGALVWWTTERGLRRLLSALLGVGLVIVAPLQIHDAVRIAEIRRLQAAASQPAAEAVPTADSAAAAPAAAPAATPAASQPAAAESPAALAAELKSRHQRAENLLKTTLALLAVLLVLAGTQRLGDRHA